MRLRKVTHWSIVHHTVIISLGSKHLSPTKKIRVLRRDFHGLKILVIWIWYIGFKWRRSRFGCITNIKTSMEGKTHPVEKNLVTMFANGFTINGVLNKVHFSFSVPGPGVHKRVMSLKFLRWEGGEKTKTTNKTQSRVFWSQRSNRVDQSWNYQGPGIFKQSNS